MSGEGKNSRNAVFTAAEAIVMILIFLSLILGLLSAYIILSDR